MRDHIGRRLSFANVAAAVALFAALGGGAALAAGRLGPKDIRKNAIHSKHIKRNAIKSKHIKRNAVRSKQIKNGSLKAIDFHDGAIPPGAQGPRGPVGPQGPAGPTYAAFTSADDGPDTGAPLIPTTIASLDLGPGSYLLSADTVMDNNTSSSAAFLCWLYLGDTEVAREGAQVGASVSTGNAAVDEYSVAIQGGGTLAANSTATLKCRGSSGASNAFSTRSVSLSAVRVGTLDDQS